MTLLCWLHLSGMVATKALLNTPKDTTANALIMVNGRGMDAHAGEMLIDSAAACGDGDDGGIAGGGVA